MYGHWTIVPFNFLKFNFFSAGGDFYGTHPWHWYFSQGFPVMVFTFLPISALGMWWARDRLYAGLICWVLTVYSVLGHKEFRFLTYPKYVQLFTFVFPFGHILVMVDVIDAGSVLVG